MPSLLIHRRIGYLVLLLIFSVAFLSSNSSLAASEEKDTPRTEVSTSSPDLYHAALLQTYQELFGSSTFALESATFNALFEKVNNAHKNKNPEQVLGLIINNMNIVKGSSSNKQIPELVRIALQNHSIGVARQIRATIEAQAPRSITATCDYEIANHLAKQNEWDEALTILKTLDLGNDLSSVNADNALIIWGAALQHIKKHRQALEYYQRVKSDSPVYPLAQLDTALVYIRQDWWTDAQISMEIAVKANKDQSSEFNNRVYTTLGFSQLQQGFYRNARDTFRKVKIKSEYADQALLGLGMAALNQEDFVGAFNAFDQLKRKQQPTAPVEQSYSMSAFTLTKLKQNKSAAAAYAEAQVYYEGKVNLFSNAANQLSSTPNSDLQNTVSNLVKEGYNEAPEGIAYGWQLKTLARLLALPVSESAKAQISTAYSKISMDYQAHTKRHLDEKLVVLNSYLNQSRYGLTKLYDTP